MRSLFYDISRYTVEVFGLADATFRRRIQHRVRVSWPKGFAILQTGEMILSGGVVGSEAAVHFFEPTGEWLAGWGRLPTTENWQAALVAGGGAVADAGGGGILFSRAAPHEVLLLRPSREGRYEAATVLGSDTSIVEPIGDGAIVTTSEDGRRIQRFRPFTRSSGIFALSNMHVLNVVTDVEHERTTFELWFRDGRGLAARSSVATAMYPWGMIGHRDLLVSFMDSETDEWLIARVRLF